jgi:hypothetical protein
MKKLSNILVLALMLHNVEANAQTNTSTTKKWGIETEIAQPFIQYVNIFRIQATKTITSLQKKNKGDLLLGAYIRPNVKHDIVEKINEYLLMVGYRQYFWKGLHAEARSNLGYAWGKKNKFDGKDYNNLSWFWEANAGYKFDFAKRSNYNFYVIPQIGILSSISSNIGPRGGEADTFPQANVVIGINF